MRASHPFPYKKSAAVVSNCERQQGILLLDRKGHLLDEGSRSLSQEILWIEMRLLNRFLDNSQGDDPTQDARLMLRMLCWRQAELG
jgi:hypothetical protein